MAGSNVLVSAVAADASALIWNVALDPDGELDNMTFSIGANAHHAIQYGGSTPTTTTLRGIDFIGFNAVDGNNDSALYFPDTGSDVDWTVNLIGCTGNISFKKVRAGDTVTLVQDPVTTLVTVLDNVTKLPIVGASVYVTAASGGPLTLGTVIINGLTDVNGQISDSRTLASNQPIVGEARSGSQAIAYVDGDIVETINSTNGISITVLLNRD